MALATERSGGVSPARVVLVGDAPWDLEVARKLDLPFVGIARSAQRDALIARGATHVLQDFVPFETAVAALESAECVRPCMVPE
jgi:phosphoglycolate phosphatase-like HAD superfamily hydrolase